MIRRMSSLPLAACAACLWLFMACHNPSGSGEVILSGSLATAARAMGAGRVTVFSSAQISSVLMFYPDSYEEHEVVDGKFSFPLTKMEPAGMVFVGSDRNYLGCVRFGEGGHTLPLQALGQGRAAIDLGLLSCDGTTAASSYAALQDFDATKGNGPRFRTASKLFESVILNPDFDGNGVVDVLEGKRINIASLLYLSNYASFANADDTSVTFGAETKASIKASKLLVSIKSAGIGTDAATLERPDGTTTESVSGSATNTGVRYFIPLGSGLPVPGSYNFARSGVSYDFSIDSGDYSEDNIVLIVPAVTLAADGAMDSVSWTCLDASFKPIESPGEILTDMQIQVDSKQLDASGNFTRIYDSPFVEVASPSHVLGTRDIKWADVAAIYMTYNDLFGNHYVNMFFRPTP